jgi:hypothetical protein
MPSPRPPSPSALITFEVIPERVLPRLLVCGRAGHQGAMSVCVPNCVTRLAHICRRALSPVTPSNRVAALYLRSRSTAEGPILARLMM